MVREFGAPSIHDLAVQLMRLCRFGGAGQLFWPVGMHSLLVADLLPRELEVYGLLHDAAEAAVADVCRPFKTDAAREVEAMVQARVYSHLGVPAPNGEQAELVHRADMRAVNVEGASVCGPRGYRLVQPNFRLDQEAAEVLDRYLERFRPEDAIRPQGQWPAEFERRLTVALTRLHHTPAYVEQYTGKA